jgi:DNA-binding cell septation regulator SpoVG
MKNQPIQWTPKRVLVKDVKFTVNNYKIKTDIGRKRLQESLSKFGLAGTAVTDDKLNLIDGNSRLEEARAKKQTHMWVSMPNRKMSKGEYEEMSAMFDFAVAGQVDTERINKDLGKTIDWFNRWNVEPPLEVLEAINGKVDISKLRHPSANKNGKTIDPKKAGSLLEADVRAVQCFFTSKQEAEYRKMEDYLIGKLKVDSTTDLIFKCVQMVYKQTKK